MKLNINLNAVSETALLTLQCHALDARSGKPYLNDLSSIHTMEVLKTHFRDSDRSLHKDLLKHKISSSLIAHTALRSKKYDESVRGFLVRYPEAIVVNIGCGLDHRFERVDNGKISFYDLDLPDIINIKKQIFPETERYKQISQSVFDFDWIDKIKIEPVILLAEGVFMYCREKDVKALFLNLQERLRNPEIVFEVFSAKWLKGWRKSITEIKLKKQLKFGDGASYKFGIRDSDEIESWAEGMKLLEEWSYLDSKELDAGIMKLMGKNEALRKVQWTVHYSLND